ncbi:MAG: zinc-ribbon domain-containing protein [Desulfuromusa sp.]|nr:zinc-ribbon domain-containing protein [Desulfuromusa sp.]
MIIVCPECSTKFNIGSDRLPEGGAKVRCARCKHVFFVEKPLSQEPQTIEEVEGFQEEPSTDDNLSTTNAEAEDFSYDKFQELDSDITKEESFSFGAIEETAEGNPFSDNQELAASSISTIEENFTFADSEEGTASTIEKVLATEDKFGAGTKSAAKIANTIDAGEGSAVEPEFTVQAVPGKKGGPIASIIRILLLLILGILIIGGVFVYMNGTDQLNRTIQQIFGQQSERPVQTGQITIGELKGEFIQNEQSGELFLIRGKVINNFTEARSAIQVKGVIFDPNGKPLLQKTVFCGNQIDDQKLRSLPFSELEKIMRNQFGNELSNMKIDSQQSIPFDIVFNDLPKNLTEFSVKVTSSQPVTE